MKDTVRFNASKLAIPVVGPIEAGAELLEVASEIQNSPVFHAQIPNQTSDINVASCGSGAQVSLADEVIKLIKNRAGAGGFKC